MIFKLHLTREEIDILSFAVAAAEKLYDECLTHSLDPHAFPFDDDDLTDPEMRQIEKYLQMIPVLTNKINLLSMYADNLSKTETSKKMYLDYAVRGIRSKEIKNQIIMQGSPEEQELFREGAAAGIIPDPDPDDVELVKAIVKDGIMRGLEDHADPDLEIPDP